MPVPLSISERDGKKAPKWRNSRGGAKKAKEAWVDYAARPQTSLVFFTLLPPHLLFRSRPGRLIN